MSDKETSISVKQLMDGLHKMANKIVAVQYEIEKLGLDEALKDSDKLTNLERELDSLSDVFHDMREYVAEYS